MNSFRWNWSRTASWLPAALVLALGILASGLQAVEVTARPDKLTRQSIEPLFREYCFDCHGDGAKKGEFDLEALLGKSGDKDGRWLKAWTTLRHGFMPPPKADPLPEAERGKITRWIAEQQLGVDTQNPDPGRVTMRRLNRMEYEFTVSDLFGTDFSVDYRFRKDPIANLPRLRDMLPPDDTAYGFENIGDFQTLSPALLEKYLNLAEVVVDRVVLVHGPQPAERLLSHDGLQVERNADKNEALHRLPLQIEKSGRYRVAMQFRLGGWFDGSGSYEFDYSVGDKKFPKEVVESGGEKTYTLIGDVDLTPGPSTLAYATRAVNSDDRRVPPLELRPRVWLIGPLDKDLVYPDSHRQIFFRGEPPTAPAERRAYAREIMKRVGDRAFRRPVPDAMLDRLTAFVMGAETFEKGVAEGLMAILVSPKFLFRTEVQPQPDDPKQIHPLDEFSLAARLSYLLWLSVPDDELTGLAARGELRKSLRPQLARMLKDPKAGRFFEDFTGQWLRTRNVLMTPISRVDGKINYLRGAMKRETDLLFENVARSDRDLLELITANYTFANRDLARYYGIPEGRGDDFERIELPADSKRGGILTHASFLISTSNPSRTSPVKRGLFVLENLLAIQPPPPPPAVASLEDANANGQTPKTVREQLALHRADKSCAACHAHFDPIGIALENYDLIGRFRTEERGEPINPDEETVSGQRLKGIDDLKQYFVANRARFYGSVAEKLLTYALGRGLEPSDSVVVDRIAEKLQAEGGKFSTLLTAVVESAPFQTRRGDNGATKSAPTIAIPATPPPEKRIGRRAFRTPIERPKPDAAGSTAPAAPAVNSNR